MDKELTGADLDCALSKVDPKCEGCTLEQVEDKDGPYFVGKAEGTVCFFIHGGGFIRDIRLSRTHQHARRYSPSREWAQGGPLIERERITLLPNPYGANSPHGGVSWYAKHDSGAEGRGDTALIAAMRCFVASKAAS